MTFRSTEAHAVGTTRKGVNVKVDMHSILVNCIVGNALQEGSPVSGVELRTRNLDPGSVGSWYSQLTNAASVSISVGVMKVA